MKINYSDQLDLALDNFKMPDNLGFGTVMAPVMAYADYDNGVWGDLNIVPYGPISMHPTAKVLHYAQEIFEGMKAYKVKGQGPFIFRPEENFLRFNTSAERMAMPHIPKDIFMASINEVIGRVSKFIPQRSGESLYIRPFMFATEETLGIKPSEKFKYMLIASPSGSYFTSNTGLSVLIERQTSRAFPGGTGFAKAGGNYAASLLSSIKAKNLGFVQTIWLDGKEKRFVEEMSGMNFFAVINGELYTPTLTDSILDGITRKSIIELAQSMNIKVCVEKIEIESLIMEIKKGSCTEAFACGTAAIINPIDYLAEEDGTRYPLKNPDGPIASKIRENLLAIQEGRAKDQWGWVQLIPEIPQNNR